MLLHRVRGLDVYECVLGSIHGQTHKNQDLARTAILETKGYRVIRFWNHDVYDNLDGVMIEVLAELELANNREL